MQFYSTGKVCVWFYVYILCKRVCMCMYSCTSCIVRTRIRIRIPTFHEHIEEIFGKTFKFLWLRVGLFWVEVRVKVIVRRLEVILRGGECIMSTGVLTMTEVQMAVCVCVLVRWRMMAELVWLTVSVAGSDAGLTKVTERKSWSQQSPSRYTLWGLGGRWQKLGWGKQNPRRGLHDIAERTCS